MLLYRLGGAIARHRGAFVGGWLLVLALVAGGATALGSDYDNEFTVPGTPSQEGKDLLDERFDITGTDGQVLFTVATGRIAQAPAAPVVNRISSRIDDVPGVTFTSPLAKNFRVVSSDGRAALGQLRFAAEKPSQATLDAVVDAASPPAGAGITTDVGGDAYDPDVETSRIPELLGLLVSLVILSITFGSLLAAGMPIVGSLLGVLTTISVIVLASSVTSVSSSASTLAEMLGLAVGIDYALFLLSRYRGHLAEGLPTTEAMRRSLATAGIAVMFAGATVVIALLGLAVARIPVLTAMGVAAAIAVAFAVSIALTLLPAVALLLGERLRPRRKARAGGAASAVVARRWVGIATRVPAVTIVVVLLAAVVAARPAADLDLALPDNSTAPESSNARQTYDAITAAFGEGYNAPLTVTGDVITSDDPKKTVNELAAAVAGVSGVVAVTQATPNADGDTALIQAIPEAGQTAPSTEALVQRLRDDSPGWEQTYGVHDILVTGQTAINIDVSARLGGAMLPFACIVIGLSLILLMLVFRSIAVPIKATAGYLISVGVAFGVVVVAFQWGWLSGLTGEEAGPVVSFLPIFLMGVLFGLAMDYEMFLVSSMREDYARTGDPRGAVVRGFCSSARVVTAAALIMTSVFVAFVPGGTSTIKPIAFGLAVGVLVDAFVVRMTLVPAVMVLLRHAAWWLPAWLERRLPDVDVEGAVLHRKVELDAWQDEHGQVAVLARGLVVTDGAAPVEITARPGEVVRLPLAAEADDRALAMVLTGRAGARAGSLAVAEQLLPEQREEVSRRAAALDLAATGHAAASDGTDRTASDVVRDRSRLAALTRRGRRAFTERSGQVAARLGSVAPGVDPTVVAQAACAVASGSHVLVLYGRPPAARDAGAELAFAAALANEGVTVVVLDRVGAERPADEGVRTSVRAGEEVR
ncbi:MMPL family transporter [Mumia flava]|nr:MMPL family transporter [Mumia flava]